MKRLIIFLIFIIFTSTVVYSEEIPPRGRGYSLTKETNPIYFGYMEDYAAQLKAALDKSHMLRLRGMGASWFFIITRDGKIKMLDISTYQNKYFNNKVKDIILSVKPLPFREGMNVDEMLFSVYLGFEKYDEISASIGYTLKYNKTNFSLIIITKK